MATILNSLGHVYYDQVQIDAAKGYYEEAYTIVKKLLGSDHIFVINIMISVANCFMTNCDYVRHVGEKTIKDLSICLKTFQKISKDEWLLMCNIQYHKLNDNINDKINENINKNINENINEEIDNNKEIINQDKKLSKEELRKQRLLYYDK
jgi:hypothetical protein